MSTAETKSPGKPAQGKSEAKQDDGKRGKRTITEIRDSKKTGEKMVYMSVPDYTSAQWAEMGGVDVAVLGDSLAMISHGHKNTVPATMDMMVMHGQAVRRGAPNTFVLGCMPYQSYNTVDRALTNATRFMQESLCDAVKPQGGKSQAHILKALVDSGIPTASHIGLTPHTIAMFGGFKIQGRTADAAMKILEDALAIEDAGCFMLERLAVQLAFHYQQLLSSGQFVYFGGVKHSQSFLTCCTVSVNGCSRSNRRGQLK